MILKPESKLIRKFNHTSITKGFDHKQYCGVNNCANVILPPSKSRPSIQSVYMLCGILLGTIIVSIIITILFVDNVELVENIEEKRKKSKLTCVVVGNLSF